jgi:hypothetical protein
MTIGYGKKAKMKIEIEADLSDELVAIDLQRVLASLQQDYKTRKAGKWMAIFHTDKNEDLVELKRHIEAFKLVLRYYGIKS